MPNFKIITVNSNDIALTWIDSTDFKSANRIVDEKGKTPRPNHNGERYQIILKMEREFSCLERTARGFLGTLAVIGSSGISLLSKPIRDLFLKQKEKVRFAIPMSSEGFDISEKELQQGISISEKTVSKIQSCIKNIFLRKEENGIKFYHSQEIHRVFALDSSPGLIFKMDHYDSIKGSSMKNRHQNMLYAQTVIRTHKLGLLVIPHAKLFTVNVKGKKQEILAEEKMDINPYESAQEEYFQAYAINEAIRQLAVFICITGYSDVQWRNNPILNNSFDEKGNRKIALIDVEEIGNPIMGLFGEGDRRRGLVGSANEEQGKIVETVAIENGISISSFKAAHSRRKEELEEGCRLKEYYAKKGIIKGDEPVQVDENLLSFSTDPEKEKILKELTLSLIDGINTVISKDSLGEAIKERRSIYINTNGGLFQDMNNILVNPGEDGFKTEEEYRNATFLGCVVKKLKDLGAIYKLIKRNDLGYYVQA